MSVLILKRSGSVSSLEDDWLARSVGPGVVWFHDFRSDAEVNAFRWTGGVGNDPNATGNARSGLTRRITTDGVTGACLEILRPAGTQENSHWWRPMSPIVGSGNGKGTDDPGAGSLTPQSYAATQGGSQVANWGNKGWYAHNSYHAANPTYFDGDEYYLQMRVKMDPRRTTDGNIQGGKLFYQSITPYSLSNQEIVTYSGAFLNPGAVGATNIHRMYGLGTFSALEEGDSLNRPGIQVGSDLADYAAGTPVYCQLGEDGFPGGSINTCWAYSGGWDTLLYHLVPGRHNVEETHIEVFAAHPGETSYTKIWDEIYTTMYDPTDQFSNPLPQGYNAIILSSYHNGLYNSEFYHRFCQLIFSKSFIACPQV